MMHLHIMAYLHVLDAPAFTHSTVR